MENLNEEPAEAPASVDVVSQTRSAYVGLLSLAGGIVLLDQFTKEVVRRTLAFGETWMPLDWLAPWARIVHWRNTGAAFGMFQEGSLIFASLAVIVIGLILYYYPRVPRHDWPLRLAMGMQLGGAVGNLIDRLRFSGQVTDFVSIYTFPVFNVADTSITVGVIVLLWGVWFSERHAREKRRAESGGSELEQAGSD
ncbi:MAG: signal peptidase II [Chloroflexi bacterium]|nr:signal peptidase II [Chloroflexota bacterium]